MLRFSANLSMLFLEYSFLERFDKAAQAGFRGVEFMFPYDYDIDVLKEKLQTNKLEHTLHNLPAGDWAAGERGIACIHPHPLRIHKRKRGEIYSRKLRGYITIEFI